MQPLNFFAKTIRVLRFPTHFANRGPQRMNLVRWGGKNAKWMGHGVLPVLIFTVLVAGIAATPIRLAAQSSAAQAVTATHDTAKPEAAKPEADPNDVYLHAPIVKTLARMMHLDVETTARIFEGINFAIIVLAVGIPLFRILPKTLRNRSEKVRAGIESARKQTEDAYSRLSVIEAKLAGLDSDIAQIRSQVELESKEDEARIKSTIKEESARIVAAAAQEMEASAAQARRSLRHFAADLAIEQAAKQLAITPETDRALIAEFLGDTSVQGGRK
ncbi:MAG: ATPase [Terracidiphilus sp.]